MLSAVLRHVFLLLTFRHAGAGLPRRSGSLLAAVVGLSAVVAAARWGLVTGVIHGVVLLACTAFYGPATAAGYALISVGVDAVALPVESVVGRGWWPFAVWEAACMAVFFSRLLSTDGGRRG